jgi:hypothetical protein
VQLGLYAGSKHTVSEVSLALSAGTVTAQLKINGANVGDPINVTTSPQRVAVTATAVDALNSAVRAELVLTSAAGASDLSFSVGSVITE